MGCEVEQQRNPEIGFGIEAESIGKAVMMMMMMSQVLR